MPTDQNEFTSVVRFEIVVPTRDSNGFEIPRVHDYVRTVLTDRFGGFSATETSGYWRDGSTVHVDESITYTIDTDRPCNHTITTLAETVRKRALQACVYVTRTRIDRVFV